MTEHSNHKSKVCWPKIDAIC